MSNPLLISGAMFFGYYMAYGSYLPFINLYYERIIPLLDSSALEVAENKRRSYGELRVWGSIGWTLSTLLVVLLPQPDRYIGFWSLSDQPTQTGGNGVHMSPEFHTGPKSRRARERRRIEAC